MLAALASITIWLARAVPIWALALGLVAVGAGIGYLICEVRP